jgi:hypothetical protein
MSSEIDQIEHPETARREEFVVYLVRAKICRDRLGSPLPKVKNTISLSKQGGKSLGKS